MKKKYANFQHGDFQTQEEKWSPEIVDYVHDLILADPQILVSAVEMSAKQVAKCLKQY